MSQGSCRCWGIRADALGAMWMLFLVALGPGLAWAQDQRSDLEIPGKRQGNVWHVPVGPQYPVRVPRVHASLRSAHFLDAPSVAVEVQPEREHWELRFDRPAAGAVIVLEFDSPPKVAAEIAPLRQAGDGTLTLPCGLGQTRGEKLRFEPQPHKNTIGYWTVAQDHVFWELEIDRPGVFNVALLQGAGKNGGGLARVSILDGAQIISSLEHSVVVTGHFQNFQWQHAGTLEVPRPGTYRLQIEAARIDRAALMDVRQVHLSPRRERP